MNILKKLTTLFTATTRQADDASLIVAVQCDRCGEIIESRISITNDLSVEYGADDRGDTYVCRKVLVGKQHCFQSIEVRLTFDANRRLIDREISGGRFTDE